MRAVAVYLSHQTHLAFLFIRVRLVNADLVNPKPDRFVIQ